MLATVIPLAPLLACGLAHSSFGDGLSSVPNCIELAGDVMGYLNEWPQASPSFRSGWTLPALSATNPEPFRSCLMKLKLEPPEEVPDSGRTIGFSLRRPRRVSRSSALETSPSIRPATQVRLAGNDRPQPVQDHREQPLPTFRSSSSGRRPSMLSRTLTWRICLAKPRGSASR